MEEKRAQILQCIPIFCWKKLDYLHIHATLACAHEDNFNVQWTKITNAPGFDLLAVCLGVWQSSPGI